MFFFFQAEDGIRDLTVTGVQTCALPISLPRRRHGTTEEECAGRQENRDDIGGGERIDPFRTRRLEMVDGPRAELDRQRDRAELGELVAVEAKRKAGIAAGLEVAARLRDVEGSALDEHVRRLGQR